MLCWRSARLLGVFVGLHALMACSNSQSVVTAVTVSPAEGGVGIQRALATLREARARAGGDLRQPLRVVLEPGQYVLTEPIKITPADSGTAEAPTVIEARTEGTATLVGAPALGLHGADASVWRFNPHVAVDRAAERSGGQFFVAGKRAVLAQQPNVGSSYFVAKALAAESGTDSSREAFVADAVDAQAVLPMLEDDKDRAIVSVMQSWTASDHRVADLSGNAQWRLTPAAKWPFLFFGTSQRYVVKNLPRALDAPGEWVLSDGLLNYKPRPGEQSSSADARWPRLPRLLIVAGDAVYGKWVQHVQIKGLGLAYTAETTSMKGFVDGQAAVAVGAAIEVDGAKNIAITRCRIEHTGGYGVWLRRGVQNSEVSGCSMNDMGAGGIKLGDVETTQGPLITGSNLIQRNVITNTGLSFPGAVGILVARSSNNQVLDNVVAHTTYTGISVGWQWGYAEPTAINNKVRGNVLIDIGQGVLSDMGGIYTLGRSPGTEIIGNFIRQVEDYQAYGAGAWGVYNDEGSAEMLVKGNVVVGSRSGGYHLHYGRDNEVSGNLFAAGRDAEVRWSNVSKSGGWRFERNGIAPDGSVTLDVRGDASMLKQSANELSSRFGGALAVTKGDAPTATSVSGASPDQASTWRAVIENARNLAGGITMSRVQPQASRAASNLWAIDLDVVPFGMRPMEVRTSPKTPLDVLAVINDVDGMRSLRLTDGVPGMPSFDPHFFFPLDIADGTVVARFSIKLDQQSWLVHEWRDGLKPFNTGPSMVFTARGLEVAGRVVVALPLATWLEVEVTSVVGSGRWTVRVRAPGGAWRGAGPFHDKGPGVPARLQWVGWYSDTVQPSVTAFRAVSVLRR